VSVRGVLAALLVLLAAAAGSLRAAEAERAAPRVAPERVVFSTDLGDLVLALYPEVAPRHVEQILELVRLGAYDGTRVVRCDPGFFVQISQVSDREPAPTPEQVAAERRLPAEFSDLPHRLGTLSMARLEDPDSARSSFSILLAEAPHLDGQYTVFGHLESGGATLRRIAEVPRDGDLPRYRIAVRSARVVDDVEAYYAEHPRDPPLPLERAAAAPRLAAQADAVEATRRALVPVLALVALLGVAGFLVYPRLQRPHLLALLLLATLVAGFGLLLLLTPVAHRAAWLAPLVFFGLYGLFRLMSRFETR